MNAPDKIYITENHHGWYETNEGGDKIGYIRKDALLEWAKEQEEIMKCGGRVLISDIIAKIESL